MWRAEESVARMSDCGERAWTSVGASIAPLFLRHVSEYSIIDVFYYAYGSNGTDILAVTCPVVESAILTMPSVPAEYNDKPSKL